MKLEAAEQKQLANAKKDYPVVAKIAKELEIYMNDPSSEFYKELILTVQHLSKELGYVRDGKEAMATILKSEDKTFERISSLLTNSEKIFTGLDKGKRMESDSGTTTKNRIIL